MQRHVRLHTRALDMLLHGWMMLLIVLGVLAHHYKQGFNNQEANHFDNSNTRISYSSILVYMGDTCWLYRLGRGAGYVRDDDLIYLQVILLTIKKMVMIRDVRV